MTAKTQNMCHRSRCGKPYGSRQVVLVRPDGTDGKHCGPYCEKHTDALLKNLNPSYTGGGQTYRIDGVRNVALNLEAV